MAQTHSIKATNRDIVGTGTARALRNEGMVPAVIYGPKMEPVSIAVNGYDLMMTIQRGNFFTIPHILDIDGKSVQVLPRELQRHPVSDKIIHVDFTDFDPAREVRVSVRIVAIDEDKAPGIKAGGVLSYLRSEIDVLCRADAIPDVIEISAAGMKVGESKKLDNSDLPQGVRLTEDREFTVLNILSTRTTKGAAGIITGDDEDETAEDAAEGENA